jgi:hypothetical protein
MCLEQTQTPRERQPSRDGGDLVENVPIDKIECMQWRCFIVGTTFRYTCIMICTSTSSTCPLRHSRCCASIVPHAEVRMLSSAHMCFRHQRLNSSHVLDIDSDFSQSKFCKNLSQRLHLLPLWTTQFSQPMAFSSTFHSLVITGICGRGLDSHTCRYFSHFVIWMTSHLSSFSHLLWGRGLNSLRAQPHR